MISNNTIKLTMLLPERQYYANKIVEEYDLPIMFNYSYKDGYKTIEFLFKKFKTKKKVMKYISLIEKCKDIYNIERFFENKRYKEWIIKSNESDIFTILNKIKDNSISIHNFSINLPRLKDDLTNLNKFILRILDYNDFSKFLPYGNYKRVYQSKNIKEMNEQVNFIESSILLKELKADNLEFNINSNHNLYMYLNKLEGNDILSFSSNKNDIFSIGGKTRCCFKKDGIAEQLMYAAYLSPIAGIIKGRVDNNKITWFSFVWETMDFLPVTIKANNTKERNIIIFRKVLILDNIEAYPMPYLNLADFSKIIKKLLSYNLYGAIRLGTGYNDIKGISEINKKFKIIERQFTLAGYEKNFDSYGHDSFNLYDLYTNKYTIESISKDLIPSIVNIGDLYRISYAYKKIPNKINEIIDNYMNPKNDVVIPPSFIYQNSNYILSYDILEYNEGILFIKYSALFDTAIKVDNYFEYIKDHIIKFISENTTSEIVYCISSLETFKQFQKQHLDFYKNLSNELNIEFKQTTDIDGD